MLRDEGISCVQLDGSMTVKQRTGVIQGFQPTQQWKSKSKSKNNSRNNSSTYASTATVLLLSLRAGGVGLHLTSASHIFLCEPSWNPAQEEQAIGRVHRIGQCKPVRVIRYVMTGTIEFRVRQLQEEKKRLAKRGLDAATTTVPVTVGGKSKGEKGKSKSKSNISSSSSKMASKMTMADIRQLFEHDCDCA